MKKYTRLGISVATSAISIYTGISAALVLITWIWIILEIRRLFKASKIAVTISALMLITAIPRYSGYPIILILYIINIIIIIQQFTKNKSFPQIITILLGFIITMRQGGAILLICYLWNMMEIKKFFIKKELSI